MKGFFKNWHVGVCLSFVLFFSLLTGKASREGNKKDEKKKQEHFSLPHPEEAESFFYEQCKRIGTIAQEKISRLCEEQEKKWRADTFHRRQALLDIGYKAQQEQLMLLKEMEDKIPSTCSFQDLSLFLKDSYINGMDVTPQSDLKGRGLLSRHIEQSDWKMKFSNKLSYLTLFIKRIVLDAEQQEKDRTSFLLRVDEHEAWAQEMLAQAQRADVKDPYYKTLEERKDMLEHLVKAQQDIDMRIRQIAQQKDVSCEGLIARQVRYDTLAYLYEKLKEGTSASQLTNEMITRFFEKRMSAKKELQKETLPLEENEKSLIDELDNKQYSLTSQKVEITRLKNECEWLQQEREPLIKNQKETEVALAKGQVEKETKVREIALLEASKQECISANEMLKAQLAQSQVREDRLTGEALTARQQYIEISSRLALLQENLLKAETKRLESEKEEGITKVSHAVLLAEAQEIKNIIVQDKEQFIRFKVELLQKDEAAKAVQTQLDLLKTTQQKYRKTCSALFKTVVALKKKYASIIDENGQLDEELQILEEKVKNVESRAESRENMLLSMMSTKEENSSLLLDQQLDLIDEYILLAEERCRLLVEFAKKAEEEKGRGMPPLPSLIVVQ